MAGSSQQNLSAAQARDALRAFPTIVFDREPPGTLGKDFRVFRQPGFLVALGLTLVLVAVGAGVLVAVNMEYGVSPF